MVNCPYLIYEASHCASCTGWFCNVFGRKKKLTDISMCKVNEEWLECTRYTTKIGTVKEPEPEPEVEEEVIELPPIEGENYTQTVGEPISPIEGETYIQTVGETIIDVVEPQGIGVLSLPGRPRKSVKKVVAKAPPPIPSTDCPYLGPVPAGKESCCGFWCYGYDSPIRTLTACNSPPTWRSCKGFVKAVRRGVKTVAGS